jgi:hypothetical protein
VYFLSFQFSFANNYPNIYLFRSQFVDMGPGDNAWQLAIAKASARLPRATSMAEIRRSIVSVCAHVGTQPGAGRGSKGQEQWCLVPDHYPNFTAGDAIRGHLRYDPKQLPPPYSYLTRYCKYMSIN